MTDRKLAIGATAWFVIACAVALPLEGMPHDTDWIPLALGALALLWVWSEVLWGFERKRLERRRKRLYARIYTADERRRLS